MASNFKIGQSLEFLTSLDALGTPLPDPQPRFSEYRSKVRLGDMTMKGKGAQTIYWSFPMAHVDEIYQLESFQSIVPIYIRSTKRNDTFAIFEVLPNWIDPREDGEHLNGFKGYRGDFEIEFIIVSEVEE